MLCIAQPQGQSFPVGMSFLQKQAWINRASLGLCFLASFVGKCTNNTNPIDLNECHMLIWNFHFLSRPKQESESVARGQDLLARTSQISRGR